MVAIYDILLYVYIYKIIDIICIYYIHYLNILFIE